MVEADAIRQKFQMRFELPNRNRVANYDIAITNRSRLDLCLNGAV